MLCFRRFALILALGLAAVPAVKAQRYSSSAAQIPSQDQPLAENQDQAQNQDQNQAQNQALNDAFDEALPQNQQQPAQAQQETPQMSVQERIRLRREQRRNTAIHDAYDHRYETYLNYAYLRFKPGPAQGQQRTTYNGWDTGITRYYSERFGVSLDGRGYYGFAFVGLNPYNLTRPEISQYNVTLGPTYRFYLQPKYSIAGRAMAGWAHGNFSGDTNGVPSTDFGLYPDSNTFAASASVIGDWNFAPNVVLRLEPQYFFTGFSSSLQASRGFTAGIVYRWGKQ